MSDIIKRLNETLEQRKTADPEQSYTASLFSKGNEAILKKIAEEATEVVMAGQSADKQAIIHESADLLFHTLVLLVHHDLSADDLLAELERRFGQSGLEEKSKRSSKINS